MLSRAMLSSGFRMPFSPNFYCGTHPLHVMGYMTAIFSSFIYPIYADDRYMADRVSLTMFYVYILASILSLPERASHRRCNTRYGNISLRPNPEIRTGSQALIRLPMGCQASMLECLLLSGWLLSDGMMMGGGTDLRNYSVYSSS